MSYFIFRPIYELCPANGETAIENGAFRKFVQCPITLESTITIRTKTSPESTTEHIKTTTTTQEEENPLCRIESTTKNHREHHAKKAAHKRTKQDAKRSNHIKCRKY